ncbi:squalene/phytoene synthase family protein [Pyruvatibacter sp.]|uniref:phytoene/squalene synthase family protein n=1 Tax=Pyruvatibacter sp. TaxID=1981328 RepID=UPI0032F03C3B
MVPDPYLPLSTKDAELPASVTETLRRDDSDRFLSALFVPAEKRSQVLALYALDRDLKRIPATVSEAMLGAIRFQWWRDTIGAIYEGQPPRHEIVPALAAAVRDGNLDPKDFHAWLDAREDEMAEQPFASLDDMTSHAARSDGTVMSMAVQVLTGETLPAAASLGTAYGLIDLLRRAAPAAARRIFLLPADGAAAEIEVFLSGKITSAISQSYTAIADAALAIIERERATPMNKNALPGILHAGLVPGYARLMGRAGFNPMTMSADIPAYRRQLSLLARVLRGRI